MKNKALVTVLVIVAVIAVIFGWYISTRNSLVTLDEQTSSAWAEIDN